MKKLIILFICMFLVFWTVGCGGNPNHGTPTPVPTRTAKPMHTPTPGHKYFITLKSNSSTLNLKAKNQSNGKGTVKFVEPGVVTDCDGLDGKFNASTYSYCIGGGNMHRITTLIAVIKDENGNVIDPTSPVSFTHDFDSADISLQNYAIDIRSNAVGVHTVTATYQGYSCSNTVVVMKRFWTGNQHDGYACKLQLSNFDENSTTPDITFFYNWNTNHAYNLTAPNGIAVIQTFDSTWLDKDARQALCNIATVPGGLTYSTSVSIPEDKSYIVIARDASGGYAKILFSRGLDTQYGEYSGLDCYGEYISSGTAFTNHF